MKRAMLSILVSLFAFSQVVQAKDDAFKDDISKVSEEDATQTQKELASLYLKKTVVPFYQGYSFDIDIVDNLPFIDVFATRAERVNKKLKTRSKLLFSVKPQVSKANRLSKESFVLALKSFSPTLIVKSKDLNMRDALRFDFLDKNKHLKYSEWLNKENGIEQQTLLFDGKGRVSNGNLILGLETKPSEGDILKSGAKYQVIKFDTLKPELRALDFGDVKKLDFFCAKILKEFLIDNKIDVDKEIEDLDENK